MKQIIQKLDLKKIGYVLAIFAVVSVFVAGVKGIAEVQSIGLQTYAVSEQNVGAVEPKGLYTYEFLCVGSDMVAIQIQGMTDENTHGIVSYQFVDSKGNIVIEESKDITELHNPDFDGIWLDVSEWGLVQGERYEIRLNFPETIAMQLFIARDHICIRQLFNFAHKTLYTCVILAIMILAVVWLWGVYKKGYGVKIFLITSLIVGVFLIFAMPAVSRDDEYRHFLRGYMDVAGIQAIVEIPTGGESGLIGTQIHVGEHMLDVPYEINEIRLLGYEDNANGYGYAQEQNWFLCLDKLIATLKADSVDETYRVAATGVALKGTVSYWPQILSMKIAKALGVTELLLYYAARFGQMLACVLMEALAMKLAPKMKEMIWLLAFIPNAFLLKASCNPDGLLISEIILLVSIIVWMKEEKIDVLSLRAIPGWIGYLGLTYCMFLVKLPYVLISVGLLLYLGKDNIKKMWDWIKAHKKITIGIVIGIVLIGIVGVVVLKDTLLMFFYFFLPQNYVMYIASHPLEIMKLFATKWVEMFINLYSGMKGCNLFPYPIAVFGILLMLKIEQPIIKRVWFAALFGVMVMIIVLVGYTLTPPDYGQIWGIGYRYLLPFMVVGALCLPSGNDKTQAIAVKLMPIVIFATMTVTTITWLVEWSV